MSTTTGPIFSADAFVETEETPRKLSGRSAERSPYFDLIVKMSETGKGQMTPNAVPDDDATTLMSDLRTGLRQVNTERESKGAGKIFITMRRVMIDPKTGKRVRKNHQLVWFKITDQPGRRVGPRVDRANGEAPAEAQGEEITTDGS